MSQKTFAVALMDAPYESENLTTAFRILDAMARRGHNINLFAFEGASGLAFAKQAPHPNPVHGKNLAEENHPRAPRAHARGRPVRYLSVNAQTRTHPQPSTWPQRPGRRPQRSTRCCVSHAPPRHPEQLLGEAG